MKEFMKPRALVTRVYFSSQTMVTARDRAPSCQIDRVTNTSFFSYKLPYQQTFSSNSVKLLEFLQFFYLRFLIDFFQRYGRNVSKMNYIRAFSSLSFSCSSQMEIDSSWIVIVALRIIFPYNQYAKLSGFLFYAQ